MQDDAQDSTGIAKPRANGEDRSAKEARKAKEVAEMPALVHRAIEDNMSDYKYLSSKASR